MTLHRRVATIAVTAALLVAACGGDDDASTTVAPAPTTPAPGSGSTEAETSVTTSAGGSGTPAPTIPADAPAEFLPGIGPIAVLGEALPVLPESGADPAVGMAAPVLVGETFDGDPVRIDAAVDGPTWIVFLAHWCPHCNDEIPVINQLRDDGRIPDGLDVVGVSTAVSPDRPNWPPGEWLAELDWTYTAVPDGVDVEEQIFVAASAYGVGGFPFSVLVDADGTVAARWSGGREPDELVSLITTSLSLT